MNDLWVALGNVGRYVAARPWLAIGFAVLVAVSLMLSVALDGPDAWR
jgi:ElaB/YqjD/DUF883 family membrane-anchored ribosome-binding protein